MRIWWFSQTNMQNAWNMWFYNAYITVIWGCVQLCMTTLQKVFNIYSKQFYKVLLCVWSLISRSNIMFSEFVSGSPSMWHPCTVVYFGGWPDGITYMLNIYIYIRIYTRICIYIHIYRLFIILLTMVYIHLPIFLWLYTHLGVFNMDRVHMHKGNDNYH